jgi:hypothetical protein
MFIVSVAIGFAISCFVMLTIIVILHFSGTLNQEKSPDKKE